MQFFNSDKMYVDFIGKRRLFMMISALVIVVGIVALFVRGGLNYGIDFAGGTMVQVRFVKTVASDDIRHALAAVDMGDASIQQFEGDKTHEFLIRVEETRSDLVGLSDEIKVVLDKAFGSENVDIRRVEMVGPKVGKDLRRQGMLAIVYALIGILIYVTVRFELRFALGAIVALAHDVMITVGVFALLDKEFSLSILAALLAIVGYSLNDTIVVYDRIRENMKSGAKVDFNSNVNASINQTLSRTILTSLTTILVLISLFVLGGGVIHDFAFAMIVGVVVGTYSSIFIASPVVILMQPKKK
ncbi:MAG: protein translocase subunit SecF [Deltaproteobacteria bacterium]|nr:protein translocase subunit SecF [Deltaproteobacteria bacterium]